MDSIQSYPVLVIGAADSGSASLMNLIAEYGSEMPVRLYEEIPAGADWSFKAVWVVTETYYCREQMEKTIEKIRAVKADPKKHGVNGKTIWIMVATDAAAAAAVAAAQAAAAAAARVAAREKLAEKLFDLVDAELDWIPDDNKYRQPVSIRTGTNIAELIDIALPEPILFMTNMFTNPESMESLTVYEKLHDASREIARFKKDGTEARVKKYPGETTIHLCSAVRKVW